MTTTRPAVLQQNRGEGNVDRGVKQKTMAAGEGKNRRALGDIGNLVTIRGVDGKPLPQVTRPVTRSFCAQLLANAQATAQTKKKPLSMNGEGKIVVDGATKARVPNVGVQKKKAVVAPKPTPPSVIEISPDSNEFEKENPVMNKGKSSEDVA